MKSIFTQQNQQNFNTKDFAVFSQAKIDEVNGVWQPNPDTVVLEDLMYSINNEEELNQDYHELKIVKMNGNFINPIQRKPIFMMPRKTPRVPITLYKQYLDSLHCICKSFGYDNIKQRLFRNIDEEFAKVEEEFRYRMQKQLVKQSQIDLMQAQAQNQKMVELVDEKYFQDINSYLCQYSDSCFNKLIKGEYLNMNAQINSMNQAIQLMNKTNDRYLDLGFNQTYVVQDIDDLIQKQKILNVNTEPFKEIQQNLVHYFSQTIDSYQVALVLQQKIQGRRVIIDQYISECADLQCNIDKLFESTD